MSTTQIQKKKWLTFEEISPKWSIRIMESGGFMKLEHDISRCLSHNGKRSSFPSDLEKTHGCIVGEYGGGDRQYWGRDLCLTCVSYSMEFFMAHSKEIEDYNKIQTEEDFENVKQDFVKHFNEVHIK